MHKNGVTAYKFSIDESCIYWYTVESEKRRLKHMTEQANTQQRIRQLTNTLLADYEKGRVVDKKNHFDDPSKEIVVDILKKVQIIIFPGYFRNEHYRTYTMENTVSMLLEDVLYNLTKQISLVWKHVEGKSGITPEQAWEEAQEIALTFFEQIPMIRECIETDVEAAYEGDPAAFNKDEIIFSYPGFYAIIVHRIAHVLHKLGVPMIPRIMSEYAHTITGVDIHPGATIGKYFFIDHGTGIVIGETTIIGENVKIYQGVTLGALSTKGGQKFKNMKRHPTIEDNVTIYSGASILGGETVIGKDVVIGGNAFVTKSIGAGTRVSIKNQELIYNREKARAVRCVELEQDENWQ